MPIREFPDPRTANEDGVVAIGGDLHPDSLRLAYSQGIFPWPFTAKVKGLPIAWFCPEERAILEFDSLHVSSSLEKLRRKKPYHFTIDRDFRAVISACAAAPRPGQSDTWITDEMVEAYCKLHMLGIAHSAEAWQGTQLVGGIYGVDVEGATFAGESMFFRKPGASKLALLHLIDHLKERGCTWMDIQVMTPHMKRMGAILIPREGFLQKLKLSRNEAAARNQRLF